LCSGFRASRLLYSEDEDIGELYGACKKHPKDDYLTHEGFLFKRACLCVPKYNTRELLIREVHVGSLVSDYGETKTLTILKGHYYWPEAHKDVQGILKQFVIC